MDALHRQTNWLMPATNPILCSTDEIAEYDPPTPDADPQYVHIPRFHRMGRQGWDPEEDRRSAASAGQAGSATE